MPALSEAKIRASRPKERAYKVFDERGLFMLRCLSYLWSPAGCQGPPGGQIMLSGTPVRAASTTDPRNPALVLITWASSRGAKFTPLLLRKPRHCESFVPSAANSGVSASRSDLGIGVRRRSNVARTAAASTSPLKRHCSASAYMSKKVAHAAIGFAELHHGVQLLGNRSLRPVYAQSWRRKPEQ